MVGNLQFNLFSDPEGVFNFNAKVSAVLSSSM
jgi:hypothetical protein